MKVSIQASDYATKAEGEGTHVELVIRREVEPGRFRTIQLFLSEVEGNLLVNASDRVVIRPNFSNQFVIEVQ